MMVRQNPTRIDYLERLQALIEEYNNGAINVEIFFRRLSEFTKDLTAEEQSVGTAKRDPSPNSSIATRLTSCIV